MEPIAIPLGNPYQKAPEAELNDNTSAFLWDGYVNDLDHKISRDGLTVHANLGTSKKVTGGYESIDGVVYVVSNGKLFSVSANGTSTEITPNDGAKLLAVGTVVNFTEDGHHVLFVDGTHLFYISSGKYYRIDDIVSGATHVVYARGYMLTTGLMSGGKEGDITYCIKEDDGSYLTVKFGIHNTELFSDGLAALVWLDPNLIALGFRSVETLWFTGDATGPIAPVDSTPLSYGTICGDSVAVVGTTVIFVSAEGQSLKVKMLAPGSGAQEIHMNILPIMQAVTSTTIKGRAFLIDGGPAYMMRLTCGSATRTMVFHLARNLWYEWTYAVNYPWRLSVGIFVSSWGIYLVGDIGDTGLVYVHEGPTDDDEPIAFEYHTGLVRRGTYKRKFCKSVFPKIQRGGTSSPTVPAEMYLYWKDQLGSWKGPRTINMGTSADVDPNAQRFTQLGHYRDRMWSFYHDDPDTRCIIIGMDELVTIEK